MRIACLFLTLFSLVAEGRAQTVSGVILDSNKRPISEAVVSLRGAETFSARTRADGTYHFDSVSAGTYTLRAQKAGAGVATSGSFTVSAKGTKTIDLTLEPAPQFFDVPQFVVAGVTDSTYQGGHGSGMPMRSADALAKATASLSQEDVVTNKDALETARALQRAADADPSEANLFNWGTDLLVHRAAEQAIAVFEKGHKLYPNSVRMLLGLGTGWYARGVDDEAVRYFFAASDLNPSDPTPYFFLEKLPPADGFVQRFALFAGLQPQNALANYDYAESMWKQRKDPEETAIAKQVLSLLDRALAMDPHLAAAYLLRGIVYAARKESTGAMEAYQKAIAADPQLAEAHYRLALEYRRMGEIEKAGKELEIYQKLSRQSEEVLRQERAAIPQFVITLRNTR